MPKFDSRDWSKFHDDPSQPRISAPLRHYYPSSRQDIIDIITAAESSSDGQIEVRACGSHWALSDAAATTDFIVETHDPAIPAVDVPRLNRTLTDVLPPCLSDDAKAFFRLQKMDPFDPNVTPDLSKFYLYHVEAGARIYELYSRLDAWDIGVDKSTSLATWLYNAGLREYDGPWAMETLGSSGGQTIVGAFSTGDVHLPPIADAVQAIHLISNTLYPSLTKGPQPQEYWIKRPLGPYFPTLVNDALIENIYPGIKVIRDPDVFRSVLVSAGRMGIIYSVVLRVVRQYALHEERQSKDVWSSVKKWIADPTHPNFNRRFVQVVVNLNRHASDEDHSCWVTLRDLKALSDTNFPYYGRAERGSPTTAGNSYPLADPTSGTLSRTAGDFFNKMCASDSALRDFLNGLVETEEATRDAALVAALALALAIPFAVFGVDVLEAELATALATAALAQAAISLAKKLLDTLAPGPLYNTLGTVGNWAAENDGMDIFRGVAEAALGFDQSQHDYTAISYAIMDTHNYLDIGCVSWGHSAEFFFDFSSTAAAENVVAFLDLIFEDNNAMNNGWFLFDDPALSNKKWLSRDMWGCVL